MAMERGFTDVSDIALLKRLRKAGPSLEASSAKSLERVRAPEALPRLSGIHVVDGSRIART
ncbi:hypothetical protein N825_33965 [Skermanella stibiiresistens SB22]|uniref:Uncharacterized protein n=2 Tax=Skermanella TaxID=204447 RepID=W9H853_9PROT|nr:hypothetical protein N825_33965 [Skermanella stibiiresistens SB22]